MTEEMIVKYCSPTLAGLKTGNMFSYFGFSEESLLTEIRKINRCLRVKGVRLIPLKKQENRVLLYLYRPSKLKKDLENESVKRILEDHGYENNHSTCCIAKLIKRIKENSEFPHEIGLFLGYPPEDVVGFINNKACNCKCVGCWKVYGDEKKALKIFEEYEKCTKIYCEQWKGGKSLEYLCVAG